MTFYQEKILHIMVHGLRGDAQTNLNRSWFPDFISNQERLKRLRWGLGDAWLPSALTTGAWARGSEGAVTEIGGEETPA